MTRGCLNIALSERIPKTYCRNGVSDSDSCPSRSGIAQHPFNARQPNISASLGFNMWKGSRVYRQLIASYFQPAGKTGKLTAQYIAGIKEGRGREAGERASERARRQGTTDRVDTINCGHRQDLSLHWRRKLLPSFPEYKKKKKKTVEPIIARPTDLLHIRLSLPNWLSSRSTSPSAPRAHLGITVLPGVSARNSRCTRVVASCY